MTEYTLHLSGMTCGSCEQLITRTVEKHEGHVKKVDTTQGIVILECPDDKILDLKISLAERGFRERDANQNINSTQSQNQARVEIQTQKTETQEYSRGEPKRLLKYANAIIVGEEEVKVEARTLSYSVLSFGTLILLTMIGFETFGASVSNAGIYLPLILLAIGGSIMTVASYNHMKSYGNPISCANGMMIGMTIGMLAGFMAGAIIGATNGMFLGSVIGVIIGVVFGGDTGRHAGVMGLIEGVMAGFMSGTMGAMLSVMLVNDHILEFLFLSFAICGFLLFCLSYMMHREAGKCHPHLAMGFVKFFALSTLYAAVMIVIMISGPKVGAVYG